MAWNDLFEVMPGDASDAIGEMLMEAIRERDAERMNTILRQGYLFGSFSRSLSPEDNSWALANISEDRL